MFWSLSSLVDVSARAWLGDSMTRVARPQRHGKIPALMDGAGFARLLTRLDSDVDRAADAYEHLRRALEKYFEWHGAWPADECADETIDRLLRKLDEVDVQDVTKYARGIARLVLLERRRQPAALSLSDHPDVEAVTVPLDDDTPLQRCFDRCLETLPPESRSLVLQYYVAERQSKIDLRRSLARSIGVTESALRNRVQRVRDRLERCVETCIGHGETGSTP